MKLTHIEIIRLIEQGHYQVDLENGVIVSGRNGKPIYVDSRGKNGEYPRVTLWKDRRRSRIPVAHVVWLAGAKVPIPEGFEIHHKDTDVTHNWWDNLFCLFEADHRKLHNGHRLIDGLPDEEETPF